jgi:hypothetical protein
MDDSFLNLIEGNDEGTNRNSVFLIYWTFTLSMVHQCELTWLAMVGERELLKVEEGSHLRELGQSVWVVL